MALLPVGLGLLGYALIWRRDGPLPIAFLGQSPKFDLVARAAGSAEAGRREISRVASFTSTSPRYTSPRVTLSPAGSGATSGLQLADQRGRDLIGGRHRP